ncbi:MAG: single-stranded DNA-binding protein [Steroidobacteraceae bacterium]
MLTVNIAGRLGRDAELRHTPAGKAVCNFSVAVDRRRGEEKQTVWVDCHVWEKRAEALQPYLKKGTAVAVSGDLAVRQFDKRDGGQGVAIDCTVRELTLLGGAANGDQAPAGQGPTAAQRAEVERSPAPPPRQSAPAVPTEDEFADSEIPF